MEFNLKKYLCCLIFAILCVSTIIPLGYATTVSAKDLNTNIPSEDSTVELPEDNNDNSTSGEPEYAPIFRDAYSAYNFAKEKLNSSIGWDVTYTTRYAAEVYGITGELYTYTEVKKNNNKYFSTIITTNDIPVADDLFRYDYQEDDIVTYRLTLDVNKENVTSVKEVTPNWNDNEVKLATSEKYLKEENSIGFDLLPIEITKKTAKIDYFISDSKYYRMSFTVNVDTLSEAYLNYANIVKADAIGYSYVNVSFVIDKKTGNLISSEKKEKGFLSIRGFDLDVDATTNYVYKNIGIAAQFTKPADLTPTEEAWNKFKEENGIA